MDGDVDKPIPNCKGSWQSGCCQTCSRCLESAASMMPAKLALVREYEARLELLQRCIPPHPPAATGPDFSDTFKAACFTEARRLLHGK